MKRGEGDFALKTACAKLGVVRRRVDQACYDKDFQTSFYLFYSCTDTGVIVTHALPFYRPLAPLFC